MAWNTIDEARRLWRDAPPDDLALTLYLESAHQACRAYAPAPTPDDDVRFVVTVTDGAVTDTEIVFDADLAPDFTGVVEVPSSGAVFRFSYSSGTPTDIEIVSTVPDAWRLAELMQARNIYNAAKASPSGDLDGSGYGLATHPLDWQIKQLLRPRRVLGAVL